MVGWLVRGDVCMLSGKRCETRLWVIEVGRALIGELYWSDRMYSVHF